MNSLRTGQKDTPIVASISYSRGSGRVAKKRVRIIKKVRIRKLAKKFPVRLCQMARGKIAARRQVDAIP